MCRPVTLSRGIKQGDSISSRNVMNHFFKGLLYHWMAQLN